MTVRDSRLQWRKSLQVWLEVARELELEVGPEYVAELLQFHNRT